MMDDAAAASKSDNCALDSSRDFLADMEYPLKRDEEVTERPRLRLALRSFDSGAAAAAVEVTVRERLWLLTLVKTAVSAPE